MLQLCPRVGIHASRFGNFGRARALNRFTILTSPGRISPRPRRRHRWCGSNYHGRRIFSWHFRHRVIRRSRENRGVRERTRARARAMPRKAAPKSSSLAVKASIMYGVTYENAHVVGASNLILLRKLRLRGQYVRGLTWNILLLLRRTTALTYPTPFIDSWSLATPSCTFNESQRATYVLAAPTSPAAISRLVCRNYHCFAFAFVRPWIAKSAGIAKCFGLFWQNFILSRWMMFFWNIQYAII